MSLRMSYWGSKAETMAWMDSPKCAPDQTCATATAGPGILSDFAVSEQANQSTAPNRTMFEFKHFMEKVSDVADREVRDGAAAQPHRVSLIVPLALLGALLAVVGFAGRLFWVRTPNTDNRTMGRCDVV